MSQPSTKPMSGMRDFLPKEARRRRQAFRVIEETFQIYGFDPLETPTMERLSTLLGKYGEEGDQLIFKVLKRGQKLERAIENQPTEESLADAGLRYDLTVPLARVYAQYPNDFPRIFKRYQIAPVWRADRPQKGRYREFCQCDVDIVGTSSLLAEVEVISALVDILHKLDFKNFTVHINHRDLLFAIIEYAKIPKEKEMDAVVALDKFDKIGVDGVRNELNSLGISESSVASLLEVLTQVEVSSTTNGEMFEHLKKELGDDLPAIHDLATILSLVENTPASSHLAVDPFLARGLSYYTGPIFEIRSADFSGSLGGGGRYDRLIGMFRAQDVPAVGFSLGIERILMLLEGRATDEAVCAADVLITLWSEEFAPHSLQLASELRRHGIRTDIYCGDDRYGKQFSYADERNIPYTIILAPEEVEADCIKVKDMKSGEQYTIERSEVIDWICSRI